MGLISDDAHGFYYIQNNSWLYAPAIIQSSLFQSVISKIEYTDSFGRKKVVNNIYRDVVSYWGDAEVDFPTFDDDTIANMLEGPKTPYSPRWSSKWSSTRMFSSIPYQREWYFASPEFTRRRLEKANSSVSEPPTPEENVRNSCWLGNADVLVRNSATTSYVYVTNVQNFVNLRQEVGFSSRILSEVPLNDRGGSVSLNSFESFPRWIPRSVMPQPGLVLAG